MNPITPLDALSSVDDTNVDQITTLPPPEDLLRFFPIAGKPAEATVKNARSTIQRIMTGSDDRLAVVI
jgi:3-deoxy-7-phosphoheptulonate synthase